MFSLVNTRSSNSVLSITLNDVTDDNINSNTDIDYKQREEVFGKN